MQQKGVRSLYEATGSLQLCLKVPVGDCILPYLVFLLPFCYPYVLLATEISSETTPLTFQQNCLEALEWHHGHVPHEYVKNYKVRN